MKESQQDLQVQWLKYRRISYSYRVSCSICMASHFCSLVRILLDITQFNVLGPNWLVCDAIHWRGDIPCSHCIYRISGFNTFVQLFPQLFVIEKMLQMKHRLFQSGLRMAANKLLEQVSRSWNYSGSERTNILIVPWNTQDKEQFLGS